MDCAKIEDLQINPAKKLTGEVKNALVKIVQEEFNNQRSMYDSQISAQRDKLMDAYRNGVKFEQLIANIAKANSLVEQAKAKLTATGLNASGDFLADYELRNSNLTEAEREIVTRKVKEVKQKIEQLNNQKPMNVMNKIISRLWLADTCGEAIVILHQVLGNGIIPALTVKQLPAPEVE